MFQDMEKMGDWSGLVCLLLSFGLVFIGSLLKLTVGTLSTDKPSRTGSPTGLLSYVSDVFVLLCI